MTKTIGINQVPISTAVFSMPQVFFDSPERTTYSPKILSTPKLDNSASRNDPQSSTNEQSKPANFTIFTIDSDAAYGQREYSYN